MNPRLQQAAQQRHEKTTAKAEEALLALARQGAAITFTGVARHAGVSTDFLYRHPVLRAKIAAMRTTDTTRPEPADDTETATAAVRALAARLKALTRQHQERVRDLENALAAAHGENLGLRRQLARYTD